MLKYTNSQDSHDIPMISDIAMMSSCTNDIAMNFGSGSLFARCWRCGTLLGPSGSQAAARSAIGRCSPAGSWCYSFWLMISSGVILTLNTPNG